MSISLKNTRVCFIAGTLGQGGAEQQLYYMIRVLKEEGIEASVLSLTKGEFWEERIRQLDVPVICVGSSASRAVRSLRIVREISRMKPHIIQSAHFYTNLYANVASRLVGIPSVCALRNNCFSEVASIGKIMGAITMKASSLIAANSLQAIENARTLGVGEDRLFYLPNAIDARRFDAIQRNGRAVVRLLAAGRLVEQKRMDRFIRLVAHLKVERNLPVRGIAAGDGPLRTSLQNLAKDCGVENVIEFRGLLADMLPAYAEADAFVLTSDWEGTPNVVLEAMASGLPVVATSVGGVPSIIDHGKTGFLVNKGDDDALARFVASLVENAELRMQVGMAARVAVRDSHSLDALRNRLFSLYSIALNRPSNAS